MVIGYCGKVPRNTGIDPDPANLARPSSPTSARFSRSRKLGAWLPVLTEILEREAKLPKWERRSTQRLFEGLRFNTHWRSTIDHPQSSNAA
jgi:hypothetical protein